jgi:hypothetical protein
LFMNNNISIGKHLDCNLRYKSSCSNSYKCD